MTRRTSILFQSVRQQETTVTITDNEWYGARVLFFETEDKASQCYNDTVAILIESYNKLTAAGWSQATFWEYGKPEEIEDD